MIMFIIFYIYDNFGNYNTPNTNGERNIIFYNCSNKNRLIFLIDNYKGREKNSRMERSMYTTIYNIRKCLA